MQAAEQLYGPYRWGRYDVLICPPSFPIGGMENPRLTFATPTILAGDKSLVSLVAHELAHSWSGNLVTNATWSDFWLNEGFTVYLERRIQEAVFGRERAEMEALLEVEELKEEMKKLAPADQALHVGLNGRDPDDGFTLVPYVKGALFLRLLEQSYGRERFDAFVRSYFDRFAFQSITTAQFVDFLQRQLLSNDAGAAKGIDLDEWLEKPGLPASTPQLGSRALDRAAATAQAWMRDPATEAPQGWSTQEWLHFLRALDPQLGAERMALVEEVRWVDARCRALAIRWSAGADEVERAA